MKFTKSGRGTLSSGQRVLFFLASFLMLGSSLFAQWRILPLGDSITQGGQQFASYRYPLYFDLLAGSYNIDFVGNRMVTNGGDSGNTPNTTNYVNYYTTFDRDHSGYWGWRTDQILNEIDNIAQTARPHIVLLHLGTNDLGQNGASGVTTALANIPQIIAGLRAVNPDVTVLLAQLIPIGPGSSYFANEAQVPLYNTGLANLISTLNTTQSPVILVDQYTGFDLMSDMQSDGLHPNLIGEQKIADVWELALASIVSGTPPPPPIDPPPSAATLSFETLTIGDGSVSSGPGTVGGWTMAGGSGTFVGIYNPPEDTYPGAAGSGTPTGADGVNLAYLVNGSGDVNTISAQLALGMTLTDDRTYTLTVAIGGNRLPTTRYTGRNFGGYRIELLAGDTVIASQADAFVPPEGEFQDASISVSSVALAAVLMSEPLTVRVSPTSSADDTALDIDDVRFLEEIVNDYASWVTAWGLTGPDALALADPDNDGKNNQVEFAFGLSPLSGESSGLPRMGSTAGNSYQFIYTRRKASSTPGIQYQVTFSQTLGLGSWAIDPTATTTIMDAGDIWEEVTLTLPFVPMAPHRFGRVMVSPL